MMFVVATLIVLFIAALVAFLMENRKNKILRSSLKERNKRNKKIQKVFSAVFQNIHAYILVVDKGLNVIRTNYYQKTNQKDDGKVKRIGDMLCCHNAIISGKCGTHEKCQDCIVNATVTRSFQLKQSFPEIRASLVISTAPDEYREMEAVVSGAFMELDDEERMILTVHDITEIVANKREVEKLANVVTFTSALSRVGFASINLITCEEIVTPEYRINLNEKKHQLVKDIFDSFHYVYPEYRDDLLSFISRALEGEVDPLQKEVKVLTSDNSYKWIKIFLIQKEYHPAKNINEIYSLTIDVTAQKEVEKELAAEKNKAEEADRSKSAFLANMSHEIRTPLNAIVGFSELLASATSDDEKEQYLDILKTNNEMLLQLVNDILDMSKIEAGTLEFNMADVDLNVLMSELETLFNMRLSEDSQVKVICEPAQTKYILHTDRNRIGQVLSNFLSNAIKFTEVGTIRFGYKPYGNNSVYFYVTDTGMGIKKEMLENVFQRFIRFHKDKKGNGLGLSISKTIIDKLGGTIGVESVYQKGSTFWFILPDRPLEQLSGTEKSDIVIPMPGDDNLTVQNDTFDSEPETGNKEESKPVILVAEAGDETYSFMQETLSSNYRIHRAHTGEEAIMIYLQDSPVVILMALQLPEVDGWQATEAIRQVSTTIPIVAITESEHEDKPEILKNGFNDVITTPLAKEQLIDTVNRFVK